MSPLFIVLLWVFSAYVIFGPVIRTLTRRRFADDPTLSPDRLRAYSNLAVAFTLLIATQWLAQPIRGTTFQRHVSPQEEASAKEYATIAMIPVILVYSALATLLDNQKKLIKWVCWLYGVYFVLSAVYLVLLDVYEMHEDVLVHHENDRAGGGGAGEESAGRGSIFSRGPRRFLIYALYIVIDTKASIALSMVWSCVHLYFRGAKSVQGGPATTADKVYPYLNFWMQVGASLGALCGTISHTLQFPVGMLFLGGSSSSTSSLGPSGRGQEHQHHADSAIITGSSMLYFVIGIGTLVIPFFTGPAFEVLEAEHVASPKLKTDRGASTPEHHSTSSQPGALSSTPSPKPTLERAARESRPSDEFNTYIPSPNDEPAEEQEMQDVAGGSSSYAGAGDHYGAGETAETVARKRSNTSRSTESDGVVSAGEDDGLLSRGSELEKGTSSKRARFPDPPSDSSAAFRKKSLLSALRNTGKNMFEGLHIILTQQYVFLIFIVASSHLALRAFFELQGSILTSYVYQYPADNGLDLKGPNPKNTADERTALFSKVLLCNGILSGLVSLLATTELIERLGHSTVLRVNPVTYLGAVSLVCFAFFFGERHGYVVVNEQFVITRPWVEWNDDVDLLAGGSSGEIENGNGNTIDASIVGESAGVSVVNEDTLLADGIVHLQGCAAEYGAKEQRLMRGQVVAFTWTDPLDGEIANFFQLREMNCARAEAELKTLKTVLSDKNFAGDATDKDLVVRNEKFRRALGEEVVRGSARTLMDEAKFISGVYEGGVAGSDAPSVGFPEQLTSFGVSGADDAERLMMCRAVCAGEFPRCNFVSLEGGMCRAWHAHTVASSSSPHTGENISAQSGGLADYRDYGGGGGDDGDPRVVRSAQHFERFLAQMLSEVRSCRALGVTSSSSSSSSRSGGQTEEVSQRGRRWFRMLPKCGFSDMVSDAVSAGARAVILVNPAKRRRVERIARASGPLTVFVEHREFVHSLVPHIIVRHTVDPEVAVASGHDSIGVAGGWEEQRRKIARKDVLLLRREEMSSAFLEEGEKPGKGSGGSSARGRTFDLQWERSDSSYLAVEYEGLSFSREGTFQKGGEKKASALLSSRRGGSRSAGTSSEKKAPPPLFIRRVRGRRREHALFSHFGLFLLVSLCSTVTNVVNFAVNNPLVEMLYVNTSHMTSSKAVKIKAKAWISAFGSNIMKATGNRVNAVFNTPIFDPIVSFLFCVVWVLGWGTGVMKIGKLVDTEKFGEGAGRAKNSPSPIGATKRGAKT